MSVHFLSIKELANLLKKKIISIPEIVTQTKNLFKKFDSNFNSAIEIFDLIELNEKFEEKKLLSGIPCLIKDVICQKGRNTTCSSKILQNFLSTYDASVISKLKLDGSIPIGRANCDEFAMGSSNETSVYGPVKNPWNLLKVSGGSSGGSAAAVAAGLVPFALGTETGGSVRQPASLCGIVGLKPTYGSVSRYGIVAYASSLDQVGILTRNVYDSALVFSSISGFDEKDSTSAVKYKNFDFTKNIENFNPKGKLIGVIENAINDKGINSKVKILIEKAIKEYENFGAIIEYVNMPTMEYSAAVYFIISRAEAASNLARFDGVKFGYRSNDYSDLLSMYSNTRYEGFGETVRRRILLGNYVLSAGYADEFYKKANDVQFLMKKEFNEKLEKYDFLLSPVSPEPAFSIGELNNNPMAIDLQDYFTSAANLTGVPALALPCGFVDELPVGFQIIGKSFSEESLFSAGHWYQSVTNWHLKKPNI